MIYYSDFEGGSNKNGGTSFAVLATGSDGVTSATFGSVNFNSASATFNSGMVGHKLAIWDATYQQAVYCDITAYVNSHNLTVFVDDNAFGSLSGTTGFSFNVGGRWKIGDRNRTNPADINGNLDGDPTLIPYVPGDEVREMASPYPHSLGAAQWTNDSAVVTISAQVAKKVDDCTAAWTAANGASASTSSFNRIVGASTSSNLTFPSSRTASTKYFYKALSSTLDLSAWSRICMWMRTTNGSANSTGDMQLCLCSDTSGNTVVASATIPKVPIGSLWYPQIVDFGGALPSSVASIAIYSGTTLPNSGQAFALNNMIAVKAAGDAQEFTLSNLLGKVHNTYWQPSHAYSASAIRKPTVTHRNGFRYQISSAGTSSATEPTWPTVLGGVVTDGTAEWTCEGPEDTWYPILYVDASGSSTIARLDYGTNESNPTTGTGLDYVYTETESIDTYVREPVQLRTVNISYGWFAAPVFGSDRSHCVISGGWNRTDMTTRDGESWFDGNLAITNTVRVGGYHIDVDNINAVRGAGSAIFYKGGAMTNCHGVGSANGFDVQDSSGSITGAVANRNFNQGVRAVPNASTQTVTTNVNLNRVRADGNRGAGIHLTGASNSTLWARRNGVYYGSGDALCGVVIESRVSYDIVIRDLHTADNGSGGFGPGISYSTSGAPAPKVTLINPVMTESAPLPGVTGGYLGTRLAVVNLNGAGGSTVYGSSTTLEQDTSNRHTGSGVAWKVTMASGYGDYSKEFPFSSRFNVAVSSGSVTVGVWIKRGHSSAGVALRALGGFVAGVAADVVTVAAGTVNTYEQLTVTVTPTQSGVVPIELQFYSNLTDAEVAAHSHPSLVTYFDDMTVS